jgi:hypothetical protein
VAEAEKVIKEAERRGRDETKRGQR